MKLKLIQLVVCFCLCFALSVENVLAAKKMSRKAERQFGAITALLEKADRELESDDSEEATKLYGATIAAYQEFSSKYPEANSEMVKFRVAYCRNQLMSLLAAKRVPEEKKEKKVSDSEVPALFPDLSKLIVANIDLCREGKYDEVISTMRDVLKKNRDCSQAYLLMSTACVGKGKLDMAMEFLEKAIKIDPANRDAHYNLCQLLIRADDPDFDAAAVHYKISIELGSDLDVDLETVLDL